MAIFKPEMPSSGSSSSFTGICEFGLVEFEDKSGQFDWADLFLEVKVRQKGSDYDSQRRFQNDLYIDNLIVKTSGDFDSDGDQEVYWKTTDGTAYLRALMHADGNIQYANYQSESQMSDYLTSNGYESVISEII